MSRGMSECEALGFLKDCQAFLRDGLALRLQEAEGNRSRMTNRVSDVRLAAHKASLRCLLVNK